MPARGTKAVQAYRGWVATMRRAARSLREMGSQKRRHDNGSCYLSKAFARACKQLAVRHIRIKPDTPQTNGKAERFIQTALKMGLRHRLQAFTATIRHALRLAPSLQLAQASC